MVEQDAAPAGVPRKARTRAAPGLRLAANRGRPPGAWLTEAVTLRTATKSAARRRKEDAANKPRLRKLVWVARRAAPRGLERDRGHTKTMVAPLGAPSPSLWRGDKRREGRRAYPGPRQTIRVMTLGYLKSEFVNKRWRSMWRRRAAIRKYSLHVLTAIDVNFGAIQI